MLDFVTTALDSGPAADLVVLPEASLTGYISPKFETDLSAFAEPIDGPTVAEVRAIAAKYNCKILAPLIERSGELTFNSMVGVSPEPTPWAHYRKRNPWYVETWATPGDRPWPIIDIGGIRATIAMCFDVHFLEAKAAHVLSAIDALLLPSAWVDEHDTLPSILSSLARRFGITILNANWGPGTPALSGQGGSMVVNHLGEIERRLSPDEFRIDATIEAKTR